MDGAGGAKVYCFAGVIEDPQSDVLGEERNGIARAKSPDEVVASFAAWSFRVTAISSLEEVAEAVEVMEAIACGDPAVPESDFINCLRDITPPYSPNCTFTFTGDGGVSEALYAGFAVAQDATRLGAELEGLLLLQSVATLIESRALLSEMRLVDAGSGECVDLVELAEAV